MNPRAGAPRVFAVVVAYHPVRTTFGSLLRALCPQVEKVLVVDNSPADERAAAALLEECEAENVSLRRLGTNHGIAAALNIGIRQAIRAGASHVLLSDQDSLPEPDMVAGLLKTCVGLAADGVKVGAVAPVFTDANTGIAFPFQAEMPSRFFYGHVRPDASRPVVEALTLITSGMLVPVEVFDDVGLMREDLFIDHVDIEWSHRARARGWRLFGTSNASMFHRMGDDYLDVWYFGWRRESAYSPLRMYYRIRNFIAICRSHDIPGRWKLRNAWYWLGFVYSHVVFGTTKVASLSMAARGFWDGIRGKLGPYNA